MTATAEYLGGKNLGQAIPAALQGVAAADAAIGISLPEVLAKVEGTIQAQAAISISPPSFAANLEFAAQLAAAAQVGISGPAVNVDVAAMASVLAELQATLGQLQAQASIVANLTVLFGTAGIHAYLDEGSVGDHGNALQELLAGGVPGGSGPEQDGIGVYIVAVSPVSIQALRTCFGV